jgi:hypothetical protein
MKWAGQKLPVWLIIDESGQQPPELGKLLHLHTNEESAINQVRLPEFAEKQYRLRAMATTAELREALAEFVQAGGVYASINTRTPAGTTGRIYPALDLLSRFHTSPA